MVTLHTGAETIQGRKLFAEIRYFSQTYVSKKHKSIFYSVEIKKKQTQILLLVQRIGENLCWLAIVSISSGQLNLMKTYHNDANTSGITKIALKYFLDFFGQRRYRGSPPYAFFGTWKKPCYMKLVLVGLYCGPLLTLILPLTCT